MTFGELVAETRKKAGLSQKQLAAMIEKEDGQPISPQYLNDIEHDRRNPPSGYLLEQFAKALGLAPEVLYVYAGQVPPEDLRAAQADPKKAEAAAKAFRRALK